MQEHTDWTLAEPTGREWFDWRDVVVTDCEANGLLDRPDYRMHCGWNYDMATREYASFRPHQIGDYILSLNGKVVVAHNGLGYDFQALRMVAAELGIPYEPKLEVDTLVLCRMLWAVDDLIEPDRKLWLKGKLPGKLIKGQSIEAWGYRLGEMKGDYSDERKAQGKARGITDYSELMEFVWGTFNEDMFAYNKQDVAVLLKLLLRILKKLGWFQEPGKDGALPYAYPALPVHTEHLMQAICLKQELRGLGFDRDKAIKLSEELANQRDALQDKVAGIFKPWWQPTGDTKRGTIAPKTVRRRATHLPQVTLRRWSDKTGNELKPEVNHPWMTTEEGAAYVPIKYTEFSLRNRHHLANRLVAVFGWKPKVFGGAKGTDPVVDEATIKAIPDAVLAPDLKRAILDYYVIDKTYNTLANGTKAWLRLYDEDTGTIHGRCNPLGTITHRAAHDNPNLGNIPSVEVDEEKDATGKVIAKTAIKGVEGGFGDECRELFGATTPFHVQTGIDIYALEFFMLAHYLWRFDDGQFAHRLLTEPDIHQSNANLIGLPRKDTKTTSYKTIYGSGALAVGVDVWKPEDTLEEWCHTKHVSSWLRFQQQLLGDAFVMPSRQDRAYYGKGKVYQNKLLDGIPGLRDFVNDVKAKAERGYLIAIDGRKLSVRKAFAALNALLQGSGAIVCKMWIIAFHELMAEQGLKQSELDPRGIVLKANDYNQIAWCHDEIQIEHREELSDVVGPTAERAIKIAGQRLKLKLDLRTDFKVGHNWAECH